MIDPCTKKRANTNWIIYKLTKVAVFASVPKEVPQGVKTQYCQGHLQKTTLLIV